MIKVYIRHEMEDKGRLLGTFAPASLQQLCEVFKSYPVRVNGMTSVFALAQFVSTSSVNTADGVFFEIVVESIEE